MQSVKRFESILDMFLEPSLFKQCFPQRVKIEVDILFKLNLMIIFAE